MEATNPIPIYLGPEPKASRKVDYHQCCFSFVSGKVHYETPNLCAIFHCQHPPCYVYILILLSIPPLIFYSNPYNQILFIPHTGVLQSFLSPNS